MITGALMRWVNNSRILFVSYFRAPAALPSFASQHITCRAATCHLRRHLTHQHTQRMTMMMSMMAKADEVQTMVTSAETYVKDVKTENSRQV